MPRFTVRMDKERRERLREAGQRTGLSDSDVARLAMDRYLDEIEEEEQPVTRPAYVPPSNSERERILRVAARYQSRWPLLSASMGSELAEKQLLEGFALAFEDKVMPLSRVPVGEVIVRVRDGKAYALTSKSVPGPVSLSGTPDPHFRLLPLDGGKAITLKIGSNGDGDYEPISDEIVTVPHRLSILRPPAYLTLVDFEVRAILALADGPQSLEGLYQKIHVRPGFSMANRKVTRSELGTLAGQLLVSLAANDLAEFGDNPLVGPWLLTSRGEEVAKLIGGNTHEG